MKFAIILKGLREENGMTQKDVAEIIGVSRQAIAGYEMGKREPNYDILLKIVDLFNVSLDYIFGRVDSKSYLAYCIGNNIRIIRGSLSYINFGKEIGNKIGVLIQPTRLKLYETAKLIPTKAELHVLSIYAKVDIDFFYKYNTIGSYRHYIKENKDKDGYKIDSAVLKKFLENSLKDENIVRVLNEILNVKV